MRKFLVVMEVWEVWAVTVVNGTVKICGKFLKMAVLVGQAELAIAWVNEPPPADRHKLSTYFIAQARPPCQVI